MTAQLLGTFEVESPEWHAARASALGGSEIAAVVGLSPWVSAFSLWHRKRGTIPAQTENRSMNWGKRLEPAVCDWWAEQHPGATLKEAGTFRHNERPWQLGNPDRLILDLDGNLTGFLEVKTADKMDAHEWGPSGSDNIPPYYRCQTIWYGDVLGFRQAHVAVLIGGNDPREYLVEWDETEAAFLRDAGATFWQSVIDGQQPALDSSDATYEAVRQLHPDIDGTETEIDAETFVRWEQTAAEMKRLKVVETHTKSLIADQMGNARYGTVAGERVVIRQTQGAGKPFVKLIPAKKEATAA